MTAAPTESATPDELRPGLDVRPQDDLFRHVNGALARHRDDPDDRSMDGAFYRLRDAAEADSRAIVEEAAERGGTRRARSREAPSS